MRIILEQAKTILDNILPSLCQSSHMPSSIDLSHETTLDPISIMLTLNISKPPSSTFLHQTDWSHPNSLSSTFSFLFSIKVQSTYSSLSCVTSGTCCMQKWEAADADSKLGSSPHLQKAANSKKHYRTMLTNANIPDSDSFWQLICQNHQL